MSDLTATNCGCGNSNRSAADRKSLPDVLGLLFSELIKAGDAINIF